MRVRPATEDDLDGIFDVLTRRSRAAFGVSEIRREHVRQSLQQAATDHFVAEDGAILGHAALDASHGVQVAAAEDRVNDALLDAVLGRARERGFAQVQTVVVPEDRPLHELVHRAGFAHHHDVLRMWRDLRGELPEPVFPGDVLLRGYTDADGERVHALLDEAYSSWDDTYAPRPHDDWLQLMTQHEEFDPALWFLAERDGELVACALHWKEHQRRGWVKDIVVRAGERGRGLGRALLHRAFHEYARRGAERVGLKVDTTNPTAAIRLYERTGFVTDRRYGTWVKAL